MHVSKEFLKYEIGNEKWILCRNFTIEIDVIKMSCLSKPQNQLITLA